MPGDCFADAGMKPMMDALSQILANQGKGGGGGGGDSGGGGGAGCDGGDGGDGGCGGSKGGGSNDGGSERAPRSERKKPASYEEQGHEINQHLQKPIYPEK